MSTGNLYHGVVRGRIIELDSGPQLPDGENVTLELHTTSGAQIEAIR